MFTPCGHFEAGAGRQVGKPEEHAGNAAKLSRKRDGVPGDADRGGAWADSGGEIVVLTDGQKSDTGWVT
jgi:hypothetical protein